MNNVNYLDTSSPEVHINRSKYIAYNIIGVSKADSKMYQEALEFFTKAIKLNPGDSVAFFNRASIEMRLGHIKEARKDFKESEKLQVNNDCE